MPANIPAVVFIGQVALIPEEELTGLTLPTYGEYFPFIQAAMVLFISCCASGQSWFQLNDKAPNCWVIWVMRKPRSTAPIARS